MFKGSWRTWLYSPSCRILTWDAREETALLFAIHTPLAELCRDHRKHHCCPSRPSHKATSLVFFELI